MVKVDKNVQEVCAKATTANNRLGLCGYGLLNSVACNDWGSNLKMLIEAAQLGSLP